ncbi:hypothetical protein FQN51_008772 [Onygenales sp. PD_10]|nr:hypothetical protein FQN51_008772 [Onygenales sp. PD_10]
MTPSKHIRALVIITIFPVINDGFVIVALIIAIGMCITSWGCTYPYGVIFLPKRGGYNQEARNHLTSSIKTDTKNTYQGYRQWELPPDVKSKYPLGEKYNIANQLLYNPVLAFVRASIIIFILRLGGLRKHIRRSLLILFVVNFCLMIGIFFADLFQCSPVHYAWDYHAMDKAAQRAAGADANGMKDGKLIKGGKCIKRRNFFVSSASISIFLDFWLLYIPSAIVWGINMPRRQKAIVVGVMSIGVFVTGVSLARLIISDRRWHKPPAARTYDIDYTLSNIETNCAIWAAATPALKYLLSRLFPHFWAPSDTEPKSSELNNHPSDFASSGAIPGTPVAAQNALRTPSFVEPQTPTDPQSYRMAYLSSLPGRNTSEEEIRRFEHDTKVSGLFRAGPNYLPEGHLPQIHRTVTGSSMGSLQDQGSPSGSPLKSRQSLASSVSESRSRSRTPGGVEMGGERLEDGEGTEKEDGDGNGNEEEEGQEEKGKKRKK